MIGLILGRSGKLTHLHAWVWAGIDKGPYESPTTSHTSPKADTLRRSWPLFQPPTKGRAIYPVSFSADLGSLSICEARFL